MIVDKNPASSVTVSDGTWHHVGFTWDPTKGIQMYVDGKTNNFYAATASSINNTVNLLIGGYISSDFTINGLMDDVRVYNRALTPAEVDQLYSWAPSPIVKLEMDEGTGTTLYDSSGNSRNGTLNGNPTWDAGKYGKVVKLDGTGDFVQVGDF